MRLSLAAFLILLTAEGILAGLASRNFFLLTASLSGFLVYTAAARRSEGLGETVRAIAAGLIAIAAPSFYQGSPFALVMCFLALAHLLAATQAVWELSWGQLERISPSIRMRSLVFTIGFYAALALAVMLLRTSNSPLHRRRRPHLPPRRPDMGLIKAAPPPPRPATQRLKESPPPPRMALRPPPLHPPRRSLLNLPAARR
jgi:hypothetical protein